MSRALDKDPEFSTLTRLQRVELVENMACVEFHAGETMCRAMSAQEMLIIIVGIISENSFVMGSIKVPATSNTMAPNKDKYGDMVKIESY